jgi:signal transduction histidine kinase
MPSSPFPIPAFPYARCAAGRSRRRRRLARASRWPAGDPESESGEVVEVVVADNGPGIPVELLDQVFEPFITTKEPGRGTGLGLAVSASIVEAMGGTIRAASPDGGGAVFHIVLPALAAEDKA